MLRFGKAASRWGEIADEQAYKKILALSEGREDEADEELAQSIKTEKALIDQTSDIGDLKKKLERLEYMPVFGSSGTDDIKRHINQRIHDIQNPNNPTNNDFGISGISGSGGGKIITMNLDIKNYFDVAKNAASDIEEIAEKIIGRVNDRLRDAVITLN